MNTEASASGPHHFKSVASWQFQLGCKLFGCAHEKAPRGLLLAGLRQRSKGRMNLAPST